MSKIPNLFELMDKNNVKQLQLSKVIGVSQGNISDWKSGRSTPSIEALVKIAEYFNVSVDYLLGYTPKIDDEEQGYIEFFASLSPAERLLAYKIAATSIRTIRNNLAESKEEK